MSIDPMKMTPDEVRTHNAKAVERRKILANVQDQEAEAAANTGHNPNWAPSKPGQHDPNTSKPPGPDLKATPAERRRHSVAVHRARLVENLADRRDWVIHLDADETLEEAVGKRFFGLSVDKVRRGHHIEVYGHNLTWWCKLVVMSTHAELGLVFTRVLQPRQEIVALGTTHVELDEVRIEQTGPSKFRVMQGHTVAATDLPSHAAAERWIKRHISEDDTA